MNILDYILITFTDTELGVYRARRIENKTLEEVGKKFGVTRERIRQIGAKMDEKIRNLQLGMSVRITETGRIVNADTARPNHEECLVCGLQRATIEECDVKCTAANNGVHTFASKE